MKNIDFFAVVFLVGLALLFFKGASPSIQQSDYIKDYIQYSTFVIGMVLCAFNFLQIPFWVGWNLFLLNANRIDLQGTLKLYYILGTLVGTFFWDASGNRGFVRIIYCGFFLHAVYFASCGSCFLFGFSGFTGSESIH